MTNNIIEIDFKMVEVKPHYYLLAGNLRVGIIICMWPLLNLIGTNYYIFHLCSKFIFHFLYTLWILVIIEIINTAHWSLASEFSDE